MESGAGPSVPPAASPTASAGRSGKKLPIASEKADDDDKMDGGFEDAVSEAGSPNRGNRDSMYSAL